MTNGVLGGLRDTFWVDIFESYRANPDDFWNAKYPCCCANGVTWRPFQPSWLQTIRHSSVLDTSLVVAKSLADISWSFFPLVKDQLCISRFLVVIELSPFEAKLLCDFPMSKAWRRQRTRSRETKPGLKAWTQEQPLPSGFYIQKLMERSTIFNG